MLDRLLTACLTECWTKRVNRDKPMLNDSMFGWVPDLLLSDYNFQNTQEIKETKCARFVLFRLIKERSFNLLCVLDLSSERWQSTLFQIYLSDYKFLNRRWASYCYRTTCLTGRWAVRLHRYLTEC